MAENLTPKKYIDSSNMKQILTAVKNEIPTTVAELTDSVDYIKTTDIKTTLDENSTDTDVCSGKAIFDAMQASGLSAIGKETVLYNGSISATGTYTLTDDVNNYDFIIINHSLNSEVYRQSLTMSKIEISKCIDSAHRFMCVYGYSSNNQYISGYFNNDKLIIVDYADEFINSIVGYKFGEVTVKNTVTITNPSPAASYSTDEQLTGGTWIDGKPIYRKVITSTFGLSVGGRKTLTLSNFGVNNVETPISSTIISSDGGYLGVRDVNILTSFKTTALDIVITSSGYSLGSGEQKIILEYTKTTDA